MTRSKFINRFPYQTHTYEVFIYKYKHKRKLLTVTILARVKEARNLIRVAAKKFRVKRVGKKNIRSRGRIEREVKTVKIIDKKSVVKQTKSGGYKRISAKSKER